MKLFKGTFLILLFLNNPLLFAQLNVKLSKQIRITDDDKISFVEPHLAVDPTNPDNMAIGTMGAKGNEQGISLLIYLSDDGGQTWRGSNDFNGENIKGADPWIMFNKIGDLFVTYLSNGNAWLRRSIDGGKTWIYCRLGST